VICLTYFSAFCCLINTGFAFLNSFGVGTTNPHCAAITPMIKKYLTNEERELHTKENGILQFFLELMNAIGGDLHTGKSVCFLLFHRRSGGKSTLLKIHDEHPQITLTHPLTGTVNAVLKKEKEKPHRALGWMMIIDGKSKSQYTSLLNTAQQLSSAI
jgi:hypothetical protein